MLIMKKERWNWFFKLLHGSNKRYLKLQLQQRIKKMNKYLVIVIISLPLFFVSNSADGFQSSKKNQDVPVELMPKKQKDLIAKYIDLKSRSSLQEPREQ